jgi:hypothetical protein
MCFEDLMANGDIHLLLYGFGEALDLREDDTKDFTNGVPRHIIHICGSYLTYEVLCHHYSNPPSLNISYVIYRLLIYL